MNHVLPNGTHIKNINDNPPIPAQLDPQLELDAMIEEYGYTYSYMETAEDGTITIHGLRKEDK